MKFKDVIKEFSHLRWVYENMQFSTTMGRELLLNTSFSCNTEILNNIYSELQQFIDKNSDNKGWFDKIKVILSHIRDIQGTISRTKKGEILDEIELFELKQFAYNVSLLAKLDIDGINPIDEVFLLLDPDNSGVVNFYIYSSYSKEIQLLREKLKQEKDENVIEEIYLQIAQEEEVVRRELSQKLATHYDDLHSSINRIAEVDLIIAKCEFISHEQMTRPQFVGYKKCHFLGLFNPYLRSIIDSYQSVDISLTDAPIIITGANMSGKSMLLKSVALAQYLVQFGFYAPASTVEISVVDKIHLLMGDYQQESVGLSSYAAEITEVSNIINDIEKGGKHLVLIDELARTTSPIEGVAIVNATAEIMANQKTMSLITTHYNVAQKGIRKLRVRGFVEDLHPETVTIKNISQFIDYSLFEVHNNEHFDSEAIRIAEILNINDKLINLSKKYVQNR